MRINTNIASMTAQESAANVNKNLSSSLEKLSSGLRINKASDDASGMAIADKLRTQASSLGQSIENANSANALVQIADKAMAEQSNILDIIKTKLIQASTATTSNEGREAIRKDILKLQDQLNNIADQTNYNGTKLLQKDLVAGATTTESAILTDDANALSATPDSGGVISADGTDGAEIDVVLANVELGDTISITVGNSTNTATISYTVLAADIGANAGETADNVAAKLAAESLTGAQDAGGGAITASASTDGSGTITFTGATTTNGTSFDTITTNVTGEANNDTLALSGAYDLGDTISFQVGGTDYTYTTTQAYTSSELSTLATALAADITSNTALTATASGDNITLTGTATITQLDGTAYVSGTTDLASNAVAGSTTTDALNFQIGELSTNDIKTSGGVQSNTSGLSLTDFGSLAGNLLTVDIAEAEMTKVDAALNTLNGWRSDFGSTQNQLESSIRNMATTQTNIKAAESVIRDVDYAAESANFNKQNIIAQAGTYAMSQANAVQQNVMRLLQ